jgi:hypothetical protein
MFRECVVTDSVKLPWWEQSRVDTCPHKDRTEILCVMVRVQVGGDCCRATSSDQCPVARLWGGMGREGCDINN